MKQEAKLKLINKLQGMVNHFADKWYPIYFIAREYQGYKNEKSKHEFKMFIKSLIADLQNPDINSVSCAQIHVGLLKNNNKYTPFITLDFTEYDFSE